MSRIGKLPISIPAGVTITHKDDIVTVKIVMPVLGVRHHMDKGGVVGRIIVQQIVGGPHPLVQLFRIAVERDHYRLAVAVPHTAHHPEGKQN